MEINFKGKKRKYRLSSDENQFTLYEVSKKQEGKNKGDLFFKTIGHFSNLEHLFNRAMMLEINDAEIETFEALFQAITEARQWIDTIVSEKTKPAGNKA